MSSFDERQKSFEKKFAHDQELQFKVSARRNKYIGQWVSKILGYDEEKEKAINEGVDLDHVYDAFEMVGGDDVFFAATGASTGEMLKGVRFFGGGATTQSLVMRSRSGTVRWIDSVHNLNQLDKIRFD